MCLEDGPHPPLAEDSHQLVAVEDAVRKIPRLGEIRPVLLAVPHVRPIASGACRADVEDLERERRARKARRLLPRRRKLLLHPLQLERSTELVGEPDEQAPLDVVPFPFPVRDEGAEEVAPGSADRSDDAGAGDQEALPRWKERDGRRRGREGGRGSDRHERLFLQEPDGDLPGSQRPGHPLGHRTRPAAEVEERFSPRCQEGRDPLLRRPELRREPRDLLARPAEGDLGPDAGENDLHVERLGDVVVGPETQGFDEVAALAEGARHDDGQLRDAEAGSDAPEHLEPVHLRHHHVEKDDVEPPFRERRERFGAGGDRRHCVARRDEAPREEVAVRLVVVDDEEGGTPVGPARAVLAPRLERHRSLLLRSEGRR